MNPLDLLFPPRCAHCLSILPRGALCEACRAKITLHKTFFCGSCRARVPGNVSFCHSGFPYLLGAAADYTETMKDMVHALKFQGIRDAGTELSALLLLYMRGLGLDWKGFTVLPVPLSGRRFKERGFNQAEIIAAGISRELGLPCRTDCLRRTRNTPPQSQSSSIKERESNLAGAFEANAGAASGLSVLLIDDVATSGATLLEAARALKRAGARRIVALVPAKA